MTQMALTEQTIVDAITVRDSGQIEVRTASVIYRDDVEMARSFARHVLAPGDDLVGQDPRVVAVANAIWTPEITASYHASLEAAREAYARARVCTGWGLRRVAVQQQCARVREASAPLKT